MLGWISFRDDNVSKSFAKTQWEIRRVNVHTLYEYFNRAEAIAWWGVALGLPFWFRPATLRHRLSLAVACAGFVLFGFSDVWEAAHHGRLPIWLWAYKIGCVTVILAGRYSYIGWGHFSWRDRYLRLGLACLLAVLLIIVLQQILPA